MKEKIIGSIVGFAIGDAIGMPLEFDERCDPIRQFEPNAKKGLRAGRYTDNTQHLEIAIDSFVLNQGKINLDDISKRLINWYTSKQASSIGRTTELAIHNLLSGLPPTESGIYNYEACGSSGLVRILPYSLISAMRPYEAKITNGDTRRILGITHPHKAVYRMGLLLNYLIQEIMHGKSAKETIDMIVFEASFLDKRVRDKLKQTTELAETDKPTFSSIEEIGNDGYVESVMFSALYAVQKHDDFEEAVLCAANGRGDSYSRAAFTGALMGLRNGIGGIPPEWISGLERVSVLIEKAGKLYSFK